MSGRAQRRRAIKRSAPAVTVADRSATTPAAPSAVTRFLRRLGAILPAATVMLTALLAFRRLDDSDMWWHLAAGRWIAEHHAVPHTDVLSYMQHDLPWINLQWLFELFAYTIFRAGPTLLVVTATVLYSATTAILLKNLRLYLGPVAAAVMALWVLAITQGRFVIRPEMLTFLYLQIVLFACMTGRTTAGRQLWLLPAVMLLWVNSHGLFVIGAFVISCYVGVAGLSWLSSGASAARRVVLIGGLALLVTLVNPYGLRGTLFPLNLMSQLSGKTPALQLIGELRPTFSSENVTSVVQAYEGLFFFGIAVVLAAIATAAFRRQQSGIDLAGLAAFVGLAYLSTIARRNMALFALGAMPFIGQCLAILGRRLSATTWWSDLRDRVTAVVVALLLPAFAVAGWLVVSNEFYRWDNQMHEFGAGILDVGPPIGGAAFLKEQGLPLPLYNDFTTGGYLTWARPDERGVYIYSRETDEPQFFSDYMARQKQPALWQQEVDRLGIQSVLFFHWWGNHRPLLMYLLRDKRWALVYYDENATIFVRRAGNEAVIERATAAFEPIREKDFERLLGPVSSWQRSPGRARALLCYGNLLDVMNHDADAVRVFSRLIEVGTTRTDESQLAARIANYHASHGDMERARIYLHKAATANPDNPAIPALRKRIGW